MGIKKRRDALSTASREERAGVARLRRMRHRWQAAGLAAVVLVGGAVALNATAIPAVPVHGIGFAKGCNSPVHIGDENECGYSITNTTDTAHDTLSFDSITDTINAKSGTFTTTNFITSAHLDNIDPNTNSPSLAQCTGGVGSGTVADPWIGATLCTLPYGSTINIAPISRYTILAGDYNLPNHTLTDTGNLGWHDQCNGTPTTNCVTDPSTPAHADSQAVINKFASSTSTAIHNPAGGTVTTVEVGTTVHDSVHVDGQPNEPVPTGNVNIDWFTNGTCTPPADQNSGSLGPLDGSGNFDATTFTFTPAAGKFGFIAHYEGDSLYDVSDGACEPLTVVDANIQISPLTATNPINADHVLTGHVNVNDGTGVKNAPAGTEIDFSITAGPGTFNGGVDSCLTILATGECTVTISSATTGTTTIQATTTVTVGTLSLTRTTGDGKTGDSINATKLWKDYTVTTHVRDAANNDVTGTTVASGTVVHDEATVVKATGTPAAVPAPTGTVTFTLYNGATCNGTVVSADANKALSGAGVATSATTTTSTGGPFSYLAHYNGDSNYPARDAACEPFTVSQPFTANLTPGFWKNHEKATTALLPQTLGGHTVTTFAEAKTILGGMGCGSVGPLNCMAGMLLAADLNLQQGGSTCILPVIAQANALLATYSYSGASPTLASYSLLPGDKTLAMQLHDKLSAYNIDGVPTCI